MGKSKLANELDLPLEEADNLIKTFHSKVPFLRGTVDAVMRRIGNVSSNGSIRGIGSERRVHRTGNIKEIAPRIKDRIKDMILRGGENIYCVEVEGAIYEHPAVYEVAVFGLPHERLGEEVGVAIFPKEGVSLTADDLWKFLDGKISSFKVPNHVVIMNEPLPRNAAGKFLKTELRDLVGKGTLKAETR